MSRRLPIALGLIWASLLVAASPASAGLSDLYREYLDGGTVNGCATTEAHLSEALASIPADISAYDPGFATALNGALEQRASGCELTEAASQGFLEELVTGSEVAADGSPGPAVPLPSAAPAAAIDRPSEFPVWLALGSALACSLGFAWLMSSRPGSRGRQSRIRVRLADAAGRGSDLLFFARRRLRR